MEGRALIANEFFGSRVSRKSLVAGMPDPGARTFAFHP